MRPQTNKKANIAVLMLPPGVRHMDRMGIEIVCFQLASENKIAELQECAAVRTLVAPTKHCRGFGPRCSARIWGL